MKHGWRRFKECVYWAREKQQELIMGAGCYLTLLIPVKVEDQLYWAAPNYINLKKKAFVDVYSHKHISLKNEEAEIPFKISSGIEVIE